MKPNDNDTPHPSPAEADEARVLAVLLGEASPFESEAVEELLSRRPDLREYRDRTAALLGLVADAVKPGDTAVSGPELRLDDSRRGAFLEKLREPVPASVAVSEKPARGRVIRFFRSTIAYAPRYAAAVAVLLVIGFGLSTVVPLVKTGESSDASRRAEADGPAPVVAPASAGDAADRMTVAFGAAGDDRSSATRSGPGVGVGSATASFESLLPRGAPESPGAVSDERSHNAPRQHGVFLAADALGRNPTPYGGRLEGHETLSNSETSGLRIRAQAGKESEYAFRGNGVDAPVAEGIGPREPQPADIAAGAAASPAAAPRAARENDAQVIVTGNLVAKSVRDRSDSGRTREAGSATFTASGYASGSGESVTDASPRKSGSSLAAADKAATYDAELAKGKRLEDVESKWAAPAGFDKVEKPVAAVSAPETPVDAPGKKKAAEESGDKAQAVGKDESRAKAAPVPAQVETRTAENAFSTFSLNVSDVSFRLAAEAAKRGALPDAAGVRTEEFVNAQNYRDASPAPREDVALRQDQAVHPFAHNRNLLRLSLRTNAEGRASQQPLNLVVLLDNSGSMERSDRRETVAAANTVLAENLRAGDKVSVIGFARDTRMLVDRMDGSNTQQLRDLAKNGAPSDGGTNLEKALSTAYSQLASQAAPGTPGRVVLLTDGAANLGDADPVRLAAMVEKNRAKGLALDTFGVGFDGYNDAMLETLSRKGDGRYGYLNSPGDAREQLGQKLAGALRPFANDVKVQVEFNPARVTAWRLLGYDKHRLRTQDFRDNKVDAAELAAAEAGTALYTMELNPEGAGDVGLVRVRYRVPGTDDYREREWTIPYGGAPAFADASEGIRTAAAAAFVAQVLSNDPDAAVIDAGALVKAIAPLVANHPEDRPLADLNAIAVRLSKSGK